MNRSNPSTPAPDLAGAMDRPMQERRHVGRIGELPKPGSLRYRDGGGVWWRVYEQDAEQNQASPGRACLVFESDLAARRVYEYPSNWRQLVDEELQQLSWSR